MAGVALVTGAARGQGAAIVSAAASKTVSGSRPAICWPTRWRTPLPPSGSGNAVAVALDVTSVDQWARRWPPPWNASAASPRW